MRAAALLLASACAAPPAPPVATFSIVARDPATGAFGVAVASKFIAVGAVVPWARAGVGAIATQATANTRYGPTGLTQLELGRPAKEVTDHLTRADVGRDHRQVGIVDAKGGAATYTGRACHPWAGDRTGQHYAVQGNMLAGPEVLDAMARAYEAGSSNFGERLIAALRAGQAAGGDKRGRQAAALLIVRAGAGYGGFDDRLRDLRVDDHPQPIEELARLYALHERAVPSP